MKMGAQGLGVLWACVAMISIGVDAGVVRATTQHVELDRIQGLATGATGATGAATGARNPHPDGVQRGTDTGTNSLQMTARNPPTNASGTPTALGLNVKDFGAVGDGVTDDVAAIQTAIDASSNQSRALLFPAGTYAVSRGLVVPCTHPQPGLAAARPIKLVGEGRTVTSIVALQPMESVLYFVSSVPLRGNPPEPGVTTNGHDVRGITFDGVSLTNYTVYAPAITRSSFKDCGFYGGLSAGLRFGYGWINQVHGCRFAANGLVALHMADNINNVNIMDNAFEGNQGLGIVINEGVQVRVQGNVFESLGGPAIFARAVAALIITSNYFEANNIDPSPQVKFINGTTGAPLILCAEIILDGSKQQGLPPLQYSLDPTNISLGMTSQLVQSATVTGNYHNPDNSAAPGCHQRYVGVTAPGAENCIVESNACMGCGEKHPGQQCVVADGPVSGNPVLFRFAANFGWSH